MSNIQKLDHQQGKFIEFNQNQRQSQELTKEEKSMIDSEFSTSQVPLTFYKQSGVVATEQPAAKGASIDFKA